MNIQAILASMFSLKGNDRGAPPVQRLSAREAHEKLAAGEITLIDVRTPPEWRQTGTAPGAQRITLQDKDFLKQLMQAAGGFEAPVAFICRSGQRSGQGAAQARAVGFTQVYNVVGGMEGPGGWLAERLPVSHS
ncbi:MAG: sulfurtransferase [Hyphomonas sp.]|uniref:rhodanese-like domain-containing protein n=1 Tax=Hyphomonas sp. TaxID=87 RepID=UPI001D4AD034|nr:rhodanese-like domain-containing protein [Hyphomonas sp.]MBA4226896.1 sulfurtransferase [Hyphomonas sp.]